MQDEATVGLGLAFAAVMFGSRLQQLVAPGAMVVPDLVVSICAAFLIAFGLVNLCWPTRVSIGADGVLVRSLSL